MFIMRIVTNTQIQCRGGGVGGWGGEVLNVTVSGTYNKHLTLDD